MMTLILALAVTVNTMTVQELEQYYWDCDTAFMRGEMGGQALNSCLAVTEEFQTRVFNNDRARFMQYWRRENLTEWYRRGFTPRIEDLPKLR